MSDLTKDLQPGDLTLAPLPKTGDPATAKFLQSVQEVLQVMMGQRGGDGGNVLTVADLAKLGLEPGAVMKASGRPAYDLSIYKVDSQAPSAPRNLQVQNQVFANLLTWDNPADSDLSHVEIWHSITSSRDDASLVGIATKPNTTFSHGPVSTRSAHYYWIRAVDYAGNRSVWAPPDAQGGYLVPAFNAATINELLNELTDETKYSTVFKVIAGAFIIAQPDGSGARSVFAVGTVNGQTVLGLRGDMIVDGGILTRMLDADVVTAEKVAARAILGRHLTVEEAVITAAAQIATAIINDAHINNLSAGKITGQIVDAQVAYINAAKIQNLIFGAIAGQVVDAQIANVDVAKVNNLTFNRIAGQVVDAQIANISMAKIADLRVGSAQIENLSVSGQLHIAKDTIQTVNIVNPGGGGTIYSTTGRGCKMVIEGSFSCRATGIGTIGNGYARLKANGNVIATVSVNYENPWGSFFFQASISQANGVGYSYVLEFDKGTAGDILVRNITVKFTELLTCS